MGNSNPHRVVWTEIAVNKLEEAGKFYSAILGDDLNEMEMGGRSMLVFPTPDEQNGVSGNLVEGTPAPAGSGGTIHLKIPGSVEEGMQRVKDAGGQVVSEIIEIPEGRFAYCQDPDGNSISIFTAKS